MLASMQSRNPIAANALHSATHATSSRTSINTLNFAAILGRKKRISRHENCVRACRR